MQICVEWQYIIDDSVKLNLGKEQASICIKSFQLYMPATVLQKDKDILRSQEAFNPLKLSGKLYIPSNLQFSSSSFFPHRIFLWFLWFSE